MKKILLILIILLFLSSCNTLYKLTPSYWRFKSEFKKELELVQKILDNPEQMQEIIESSEFYDKNNFDMNTQTYDYYIKYFKPNREVEAEIIGFNKFYGAFVNKGKIEKDNLKILFVSNPGENQHIEFVFIEYEGKTILVNLISVFN